MSLQIHSYNRSGPIARHSTGIELTTHLGLRDSFLYSIYYLFTASIYSRTLLVGFALVRQWIEASGLKQRNEREPQVRKGAEQQ
jgi:hypothetical protein